jgi:transcriptional regulator with XRE-family HTH domain
MRLDIRRPEDFGTAVAEFRTLQGISQADLARLVGLNRTYLSNLEQGEVPAYVERLVALAGALGLTITISSA